MTVLELLQLEPVIPADNEKIYIRPCGKYSYQIHPVGTYEAHQDVFGNEVVKFPMRRQSDKRSARFFTARAGAKQAYFSQYTS